MSELLQNFLQFMCCRESPDIELSVNKGFISACLTSDIPKVIEYLNNGTDVHLNSDQALRLAVTYDDLDLAIVLVDKGADVNTLNGAPLMIAVNQDNIRFIRFLISKGANIHTNSDNALKTACKFRHISVMKVLLKSYTNPLIINSINRPIILSRNSYYECPICLRDYHKSDKTDKFVCGFCHNLYCDHCIISIILNGFNCPICRLNIRHNLLSYNTNI